MSYFNNFDKIESPVDQEENFEKFRIRGFKLSNLHQSISSP